MNIMNTFSKSIQHFLTLAINFISTLSSIDKLFTYYITDESTLNRAEEGLQLKRDEEDIELAQLLEQQKGMIE